MVNVYFEGRLGFDSEIRTAKNGNQYVHLRVATDERVNGEDSTAWINVTYTGERALKMQQYLKKGKHVMIHGIETIGTYQTKGGEIAFSRDVLADRVDFVRSGSPSGATQENTSVSDTGTFQKREEAIAAAPAVSQANTASKDDDLPF